MKKEVIRIFLVLLTWELLLNGCEQKLHLDLNAQSPVLVVNSILMADNDSVRVRVTWTKNVYEQGDFPVEANASVKLYKNNRFVGACQYQKEGWYVIVHHVEATEVYRIEVDIPGRPLVWGETRVPAPLLNASIECDSLQERIINRWTDREEEKKTIIGCLPPILL